MRTEKSALKRELLLSTTTTSPAVCRQVAENSERERVERELKRLIREGERRQA